MTEMLMIKMNWLLKEKKRLVNKFNQTSCVFVKKRNLLKKFIEEIDSDIELLECDIMNLRNELIRLGFNPDISFESKGLDEFSREYDLLIKIGASMAPYLGSLGIQYVLDDKKEMLALSLLDMLYINNDNMIRVDSRKIKRRRI